MPHGHRAEGGCTIRGEEAILERPDGTRVWFAPFPTPLVDGTGKVIGGINMLMDITERKNAEAALTGGHRRKDEFLAISRTSCAARWRR